MTDHEIERLRKEANYWRKQKTAYAADELASVEARIAKLLKQQELDKRQLKLFVGE